MAYVDKYDRYFFISGLDYPIWSNKMILNFLGKHMHHEFIGGYNISADCAPTLQRKKIMGYFLFRDLAIKSRVVKRAVNLLFSWILAPITYHFFPKDRFIRYGDSKFPVFWGGSWWCLTYDCMKYIQPLINSKEFRKYFETAYTPDELMIQTAVFNSPFSTNAFFSNNNKIPTLVELTPLHYLEYNREVRVFESESYDVLLNSGKMFFRKARSGISDSLLDRIDILRNEVKEDSV